MHHDDEPVFKRSKWGTNRYSYNPRNPVGLVLIVITLLFAGTMLILMANRAGPFAARPAPKPWDLPAYEHSWPPLSPTPGVGAP
ncbi:hypothetical protein OG389_16325 [Streptomyces sp. NBC_00435]|uniref:hypothetical protein n=1 Tax=Streptomyces sp. NBC_00435 TaxID=2903649 RepID=UPI002E1A6FCA